MKVRGERECAECGTRWSYYETASVECPSCGSLRSVGVDSDRRLHTDTPVELDLTEARELVDSRPLREVADRAGDLAREYVRKRGFVRGGDLLDLDETYLAAHELRHAADAVGRGLDLDEEEEWYFLALLGGADAEEEDEGLREGERNREEASEDERGGEARRASPPPSAGGSVRPAPGEVPTAMHPVRGLAYAEAVGEYRREMADWVDEARDSDEGEPDDRAPSALETLGDHVTRVRALEGDVDPRTAESLVEAARDLSRFLRAGDEDALASARERFERLA
ncbi:TFIIB-type zinc ribbon-containing protein [Halorussus salilacus]|uniref:DUF7117 family protein n=1 Tax=Halorussus salilacus TaxID=2953750 RepID=UPI0020A17BB3|nr:TFIIB-type zinc ribbon-containing protein [Halorussus salilacus]USZ67887.1 TFIIB-type zinc ribbon-containing protein [Halorussus salilacus]